MKWGSGISFTEGVLRRCGAALTSLEGGMNISIAHRHTLSQLWVQMKPPFTSLVDSLPWTIPFVAPEAIEHQLGVPITTRIGANESAFGISPLARKAMDEAVSQISHYNDPEWRELRAALADHHGIAPGRISVGAGIDDLLGLAVRVFLSPGTVGVASLGAYAVFNYHIAGYGATSRTVPYQENGYNDLDGLVKLAHEVKATVVYLANPDNPAGTWYSAEDIRVFLDKLPDDCMCILDEAYVEFAPSGTAYPTDDMDPRLIQMRTFSKAHGLAGSRIGYSIASPEVIEAFDKVRLHFNVNRVAQAGALGALQDQEFVLAVIRKVAEGRKEYEALGKELGLPTLPSATNFVTFDAGTQLRAQAILDALAQHGVFIRKPGAPPLDRCFRVTVGTLDERRAFAEILPLVIAEVDKGV